MSDNNFAYARQLCYEAVAAAGFRTGWAACSVLWPHLDSASVRYARHVLSSIPAENPDAHTSHLNEVFARAKAACDEIMQLPQEKRRHGDRPFFQAFLNPLIDSSVHVCSYGVELAGGRIWRPHHGPLSDAGVTPGTSPVAHRMTDNPDQNDVIAYRRSVATIFLPNCSPRFLYELHPEIPVL